MGCKDLGIRKSKFVAKTQFLLRSIFCVFKIEYFLKQFFFPVSLFQRSLGHLTKYGKFVKERKVKGRKGRMFNARKERKDMNRKEIRTGTKKWIRTGTKKWIRTGTNEWIRT